MAPTPAPASTMPPSATSPSPSPSPHAMRSWSTLATALRDPARSDFAFVPHQYVFAPADVVAASLTPTERTPINQANSTTSTASDNSLSLVRVQGNRYFAMHVVALALAMCCCVWLALFPISPTRLYNMQVDVFNTNHEHTTFFFHECLSFGVVLGAALAGYLGDRIGRAGTLELASVPYIMGWLFVGIAYGEATVLFGRYLLGVAAGLMLVVTPIYMAEISAATTRGRMICVLALLGGIARLVYLGLGAIFLAVSRATSGFNLNEWKVLALASLVPGLMLLLLLQALPDSPTWLILQYNDRDAAFGICHRLFSNDFRRAEHEVNSIIHANVLSASRLHVHHGAFYRPLFLCLVLFSLRAITTLFTQPTLSSTRAQTFVRSVFGIGVDNTDVALLESEAVVWLAATIGTVCCLLLIDQRGRVAAMQLGCSICLVGCVLLLFIAVPRFFPQQFGWTDNSSALVLLVAAGQQIGLGIGPIVLASELFPARRRVAAASVVFVWEALMRIAASEIVAWLQQTLEPPHVFGLCVLVVLACNAVGLVIACVYLPETSQRSLQDIESILAGWQPATPTVGRSCVRLSHAFEFEPARFGTARYQNGYSSHVYTTSSGEFGYGTN